MQVTMMNEVMGIVGVIISQRRLRDKGGALQEAKRSATLALFRSLKAR